MKCPAWFFSVRLLFLTLFCSPVSKLLPCNKQPPDSTACYSSWRRAWLESAGGALLLSLSSSPGTSGWAGTSEVTQRPLNLSAKSWHPSCAASYPSRCKASQIQGGGDRPHSRLEERRRICSCGGFVAGFYPAQPLVKASADPHTQGVDTGGGGDERNHKGGGCSPRSGDPHACPAVSDVFDSSSQTQNPVHLRCHRFPFTDRETESQNLESQCTAEQGLGPGLRVPKFVRSARPKPQNSVLWHRGPLRGTCCQCDTVSPSCL